MTSSRSKKHKKEKKEKKSKDKKHGKKSDKKKKRQREQTDGEDREKRGGACVEEAAKHSKRADHFFQLKRVPAAEASLQQPAQRKMMAPMTQAQAAAEPRPKPAVDAATLEMWRQYNAVADRDRSQYSSDFLRWSDARRGEKGH
eukprot:CAMPEP_0179477162 /NCGR_PEP_ID=MMETSP0799-20121207/55983_1 /TAXON_ID=46947 /ORGANISM="Geminigera cryophila, Strain CCMP2564" /LENGTH=143 /DNA_ID=CAMNT_0021287679 /DNA_START=147 /DNA_END=581 /DNA_ORIENTATION=-